MSRSNERRHSERVKFEMDAAIVQERCFEADHVTLRDLSRDGALVSSPVPLPLGRRLRLILKLGRARTITLPARVIRSPGSSAGLRFGHVDVVSQAILDQLLQEQSASPEISSDTMGSHDLSDGAMGASSDAREFFRRMLRRKTS